MSEPLVTDEDRKKAVRLWVDDLRPPPDETWLTALTSVDAIGFVRMCATLGKVVNEVSLDHDLGGDDTTRPLVLWFCENEAWPKAVRVHTANPVGREWLVGMAERYGPGVSH